MNYVVTGIGISLGIAWAVTASAQVRVSNPKQTLERNAEYRVNSRIDQGVNRGLDKVEEGIGTIFKKKEKQPQKGKQTPKSKQTPEGKPADDTYADQPTDESGDNQSGTTSGRATSGGAASGGGQSTTRADDPKPLRAYSKFDFVPGEKIVASEDFAQDAVGDFPAKWNTNGSAEVVTIEEKPGKWLMFRKSEDASFVPDFVTNLPDNFTLEYDLVYSGLDKEYAYSHQLYTTFHETRKSSDRMHAEAAGRGAMFLFGLGMGAGQVAFYQTDQDGNYNDLRGERDMSTVINPDNNGKVFHVAMWRQKQRLRVYVDEVKVFDLPRVFEPDVKLNAMRFHTKISEDRDRMFVSNIRLAVGAPDTRSKLITEGKFSTTGILFDVNSATIKPESYGVLKEIGTVLKENAGVRVRVIGHTDSDGDDAKNLDLSKRRAASVKAALASEFGIDAARLDTDGKGETQPAAPNTTAEGKANNRRVEFIKL